MKTRTSIVATSIAVVAALGLSASLARAQATAPANATGRCNDGSYTQEKLASDACKQHGGVQMWSVAATSSPAADPKGQAVASLTPAPAPAPLSDPAQPAPAATPAVASGRPTNVSPSAPAASASSAAPGSDPGGATAPAASVPAGAYDSAGAAVSQSPADHSPLVWVNTGTKVYHCPGSEWYGKTSRGTYMSESNAVLLGIHPAHSTPCPK